MLYFFAFSTCATLRLAAAFPGSMLRGRWPPMPQIKELPVQLPEAPVNIPAGVHDSTMHLSLPDIVRAAVSCCTEINVECMACATSQDVVTFCSEHTRVPGCDEILRSAQESPQEKALDGIVNKAVERVAQTVGGVKAEQLMDEYLESHPDAARKNLANLTHEAIDTVSSLKTSLLRPKEVDEAEGEPAEINRQRQDGLSSKAGTDSYAFEGPPITESEDEDEDIAKLGEDEDADVKESELGTFSLKNPWVVAGAAVLATAVSTGIAVGALCHARLQPRAREPLLSTLLQEVENQTPAGRAATA